MMQSSPGVLNACLPEICGYWRFRFDLVDVLVDKVMEEAALYLKSQENWYKKQLDEDYVMDMVVRVLEDLGL